jgi:coproporphyrinogen III oxidase-like Fe-S oxidoreductase
MDYNKILKIILSSKLAKWWRNYPPEIAAYRKEVSLEKLKLYLGKVFDEKNLHNVGLYIHIPFCTSRCHFCKYYSETIISKNIMSEYVKCIKKELSLYEINFKKHSLQSIYFGGGTPTLLDEKNWIALFKIINKFFRIDKDVQILVEGTPETCTFSKLKLLKSLGVNRLTIGAQTFDEKILIALNRRHSIKDIHDAFENARKVGIEYLNIDLLFGLPGETKESFFETLKQAVQIKPQCISPAFFDWHERVSFTEKYFDDVYVDFRRPKAESKAFFEMKKFLEKEDYYDEVNGRYYSMFLSGKEIRAYNQNNIPKGLLASTMVAGCHADGYLNYFKGISQKKLYQLQYHCGRLNKYIDSLKKGQMPNFSGIELSEDELVRQYLIYCFIFFHGKIGKKDFLSRFNKDAMLVLKNKFPELVNDYNVKENEDIIYFNRKSPYFRANRDKFVFFCLKYLYSTKVLNALKRKAKNKN